MSRNNESALPSIADGFIATAKTPVRLNSSRKAFDRKRHEPDIVRG
jgi:hypothetical protein